MNKKVVVIAVVLLSIVLSTLAGIMFWPRDTRTFEQANNVFVVKGDVKIQRAGNPALWQEVDASTVLEKGDIIRTSKNSAVDVVIGTDLDKSVRLEENSDLEFRGINPGELNLSKGKIRIALKKLEPKSSFVVKTPVAICGARGTAWSQDAAGAITNISVFENNVYVQGLDEKGRARTRKFSAGEGTQVAVEKGHPVVDAGRVSDRELKDWKYWKKNVDFLRAGRILIDDFSRNENFNNLGGPLGSWNMFYSDPTQSCKDEFTDTERVGDSGYGLKLTYDVNSQFSAYNGFFTKLMGIDISKYKYLVFYVKGDKGAGFTTTANIELKNRNEIGRASIYGITDEWKKMAIPLKQFAGIHDLKDMKEIVIVFSDINVTKKEGVIYLDDIYFSKSE